jgi:hypothetical protein
MQTPDNPQVATMLLRFGTTPQCANLCCLSLSVKHQECLLFKRADMAIQAFSSYLAVQKLFPIAQRSSTSIGRGSRANRKRHRIGARLRAACFGPGVLVGFQSFCLGGGVLAPPSIRKARISRSICMSNFCLSARLSLKSAASLRRIWDW